MTVYIYINVNRLLHFLRHRNYNDIIQYTFNNIVSDSFKQHKKLQCYIRIITRSRAVMKENEQLENGRLNGR